MKKQMQLWRLPAVAITLGVLGAMAAQPLLHGKPADAEAYHSAVRAASDIPMQVGDWEGKETPIPEAATKLLHPNVVISRQYTNEKTHEALSVLLMQCEDGRDLAGHYPPNCYPGAGWTLVQESNVDWTVGNMTITGKEYEFTMKGAVTEGHIFSDNFFVMPSGSFLRDMQAYQRAASDYGQRFYGAAQVQVIFGGQTLAEDRHREVETFVGACEPLLRAIRRGSSQ